MPFAPIQWNDNGLPHSPAFDDKYFCEQNGLQECYHVFCGGNDLATRFAKLTGGVFTIVETGFGTGLSFLAACDLWQRHASPDAALHFFSVERYPMSPADLSRALALWPDLKGGAARLTEIYNPSGAIQEIDLIPGIRLTVLFEDAAAGLRGLKARGIVPGAWFLHGFDPKKNPAMWSPEVFAEISALSRKGTTVATFTAAGFIRRGLEEAGFRMERAPGFGGKRHMLKGVVP